MSLELTRMYYAYWQTLWHLWLGLNLSNSTPLENVVNLSEYREQRGRRAA